MTILIREIDLTNKKELNQFVDLPWKIYKNDKYWVPQLRMAVKELLNPKHPFYKTAKIKTWLAFKGDEVVGRIMAIHNYTFNQHAQSNVGYFGFLEFENDLEIVKGLLNAACAYLKSEGLDKIEGPMNPGTNYECGLLVDRYDDAPQIMMTYNPPYYVELLNKLGLQKSMDLLAYRFEPQTNLPEIILNIAARTEQKDNVSHRCVDLKNWKKELDIIFDIYNSAWESNWGFVPMTRAEFEHTAKDMKMIVDPNYIQFAMVNGKEAGFILALPDLNQVFKQIPSGRISPVAIYKLLTSKKRVSRLRVIMMGVKKEYRKKGLETLLYRNLQATIRKNKLINELEFSWILESNIEMNKPLIRMAGEAYKRYRILGKEI